MECPSCGEVEAVNFGMIPASVLDTELSYDHQNTHWTKAQACPHCGEFEKIPITTEEKNRSLTKLEEFFEENELR